MVSSRVRVVVRFGSLSDAFSCRTLLAVPATASDFLRFHFRLGIHALTVQQCKILEITSITFFYCDLYQVWFIRNKQKQQRKCCTGTASSPKMF